MTKELKQLNIRVFGKVQGVWYRKSVKEVADSLGVNGMVMNEPDGSVFIVAQSDEGALEKFIAYCRIGPEHANVLNLHIEEENHKDLSGFRIL